MTPKELGQLFVDLVEIDDNGCSPQIYMKDLVEIEPEFRTTNGSQWSRANSWLGKQYLIQKTYKSGRVDSIQLVGKNTSSENHFIPAEVYAYYKGKPCVFTGTTNNIEIDHKNARYNNSEYTIADFQPVCKMMNDIKREICKKCRLNKLRPKASSLGFLKDFISGDEKSETCQGCYYYDPIEFRRNL